MVRKCVATMLAAATALVLTVGTTAPVASAMPRGDQQAAAMTRTEARAAFRTALCPTDRAIDAALAAEAKPDVTWAELQPLVLTMAESQIRAAHALQTPTRPWPTNVAELMPVYTELLSVSGGSNVVLAETASLEEYRALLKSLQDTLPTVIVRLLDRSMKAKSQIRHRLGLPESGSCVS
jgi:hypothetical protein